MDQRNPDDMNSLINSLSVERIINDSLLLQLDADINNFMQERNRDYSSESKPYQNENSIFRKNYVVDSKRRLCKIFSSSQTLHKKRKTRYSVIKIRDNFKRDDYIDHTYK